MLDLTAFKESGAYLLITTNNWFYEKSGASFKVVWGLCRPIPAKELFGFRPTGSANWYLQVGEGENAVFIAGCQIHYAQACSEAPESKDILIVK